MENNNGFTLIELLIVSGIIAVLTGGSIAAYRSFENRQKLIQEAKNIKSIIRKAQVEAQTGTKPQTGCSDLLGIQVAFVDPTSFEIRADCNPEGSKIINQYVLSKSSFSPSLPSDFEFKVLSQGVDNASIISLCGNGKLYQIQVTISGEIKDDGVTSSC